MKSLCKTFSIAFEDIQTTEEAVLARLNHETTTTGVFMVNRKFAMGYDLKLKVEPLVMVLVNDPKMSTSQIK